MKIIRWGFPSLEEAFQALLACQVGKLKLTGFAEPVLSKGHLLERLQSLPSIRLCLLSSKWLRANLLQGHCPSDHIQMFFFLDQTRPRYEDITLKRESQSFAQLILGLLVCYMSTMRTPHICQFKKLYLSYEWMVSAKIKQLIGIFFSHLWALYEMVRLYFSKYQVVPQDGLFTWVLKTRLIEKNTHLFC